MESGYLAIIITVSVLGGVVFLSLLIVCITKIVTKNTLKKSFARPQVYGNIVGQPSYVRYNDPEPRPASLYPVNNPWQTGYHNNPGVEEYSQEPGVDVLDDAIIPSSLQDIPRRPSNAQYRPSSVQDIPRRSSYVQDLPRRSSYVKDMPRRTSHAQAMPRRLSNAPGMPRTRHSYAPELPRRPSKAIQRRTSMVSQIRPRPVTPEPPIGQNKHWYKYLKEDPDYFTQDGLEWNRNQPRVWQRNTGRDTPPPSPHQPFSRRESEVTSQYYHRQAANRLNWM